MSFWPKSRYTASLEQQVAELTKQVGTLRQSLVDSQIDAAVLRQETAGLKQNLEAREKQATELKASLFFEREQVSLLTVKLVEATRALAEASAKPVDPKDKKEPRAGNWLKTRSALESQDQIVSEINPDKEKSANGSR